MEVTHVNEVRAAIYVRVSTSEQNPQSQVAELSEFIARRGWIGRIYSDHGQSGAREHRPALDEMLSDVRRRKVDVVVVWALDRLARSLKQLLILAEEFQALKVDLVSYKQNLDTSTPAGKLTYSVLGAVAEFERGLTAERVRMGLAQAKRKGRRLGRPPVRRLSCTEKQQMLHDHAKEKLSYRALATRYGTTVWTAYQICHEGSV